MKNLKEQVKPKRRYMEKKMKKKEKTKHLYTITINT